MQRKTTKEAWRPKCAAPSIRSEHRKAHHIYTGTNKHQHDVKVVTRLNNYEDHRHVVFFITRHWPDSWVELLRESG